MPTARVWLISFAGAWALWLVLAGSVARSEVIAGAAVAVLVAAVSAVVVRPQPRARSRVAVLRRGGVALRAVPADTVRLAVLLVRAAAGRPVSGCFDEVPLENEDGRALEAAIASLSPAAYVVDDEHERGAMLVHRVGGDA